MSTGKKHPEDSTPAVLFLCTGNYYRSRFAEELFNHLAALRGLPTRSASRGFRPYPEFNPGSISSHALERLRTLGVESASLHRLPAAVCREDFLNRTQCIALSETEHRPMMEQLFPEFTGRIQYWHVEDLDWESPATALAKIEQNVHTLLDSLDSADR